MWAMIPIYVSTSEVSAVYTADPVNKKAQSAAIFVAMPSGMKYR